MSETELWALVARAQAAYDALSPAERAAHDAAQRESWARGNLALDALIAERQTTHGSFASTAWVAQTLRDVFRHELGWENMTPVAREFFDASAIKFARILSGDPDFEDHYLDIQGYAELVLIDIRKRKKAGP